ncbi:MAG: hypothetical protein KatS3mg037_1224 [Ignavibacterium sp.]|nr:MAG: hypothetical protein KatS3mg037_1224 [Ignavibacterium sp.]
MFYSGIDQHKLFSYITTVDSDGKIIKEAKLNNNSFEILNYFSSLGIISILQPLRLPVEGTGSMNCFLLKALISNSLTPST